PEPFLDHHGLLVGLRGEWQGTRDELAEVLRGFLNGPVHICPGGSESVSRLGLITGGAGSEVAKVAAADLDSFITGEGPHWSFPLAEELGLNVFYGGHYATETFGVSAISEAASKLFDIPWRFIDHPTGL
ncbi:MAG: hypothetical protein RLZZ214_1601, partial [Verrucomicrobiota bacterium]